MVAMMSCFTVGLFIGANVSLIFYALIVSSHCVACEARHDRYERIHFAA